MRGIPDWRTDLCLCGAELSMQSIHIPTGSAGRAKGMVEFTFTAFLAITGSLPVTSPLSLKNVKPESSKPMRGCLLSPLFCSLFLRP